MMKPGGQLQPDGDLVVAEILGLAGYDMAGIGALRPEILGRQPLDDQAGGIAVEGQQRLALR